MFRSLLNRLSSPSSTGVVNLFSSLDQVRIEQQTGGVCLHVFTGETAEGSAVEENIICAYVRRSQPVLLIPARNYWYVSIAIVSV